MLRSNSANARLWVSRGSWKGGVRRRKSSAGMVGKRSRVMAPDSRPDFMGEYTITPILFACAYGKTDPSISGERIEYGGCSEMMGAMACARRIWAALKLE